MILSGYQLVAYTEAMGDYPGRRGTTLACGHTMSRRGQRHRGCTFHAADYDHCSGRTTETPNATVSVDHGTPYPTTITSPLSEADEARLRWYFEERLRWICREFSVVGQRGYDFPLCAIGVQRGGAVMISFQGAHFAKDVILTCMWWYLAYPLNYRQVEELMQERGVAVDHATTNRGVLI
jgi:hypothetical protein